MTIEQRLEQLEKRNKRLTGADLKDANLVDARNLPELSAKQDEDACRSDCG